MSDKQIQNKQFIQNTVVCKSEQLVGQLRTLSGLIGLANVVKFEELDEDTYMNCMSAMADMSQHTINLATQLQSDLLTNNHTQKMNHSR